MLRIWSWNVNGLDGPKVWGEIDRAADAGEVDVALLQECRRPPAGWPGQVVPDRDGEWRTAGWTAQPPWDRRTAIVLSAAATARGVTLTGRRTVDVGADTGGEALAVSRHGTLTAADVVLDDGPITLMSMYAFWEHSIDGRGKLAADASAHRLLSDLSGLITHSTRHRIIAAGDLNLLHRHGEDGDTYWGGRYASVFDRADALGLVLLGPFAPHGRVADPRPAELPEDARDVPTYHTGVQGPAGAQRQLDFVFASISIAERVTTQALNGVDEWGASDHCRIAIRVVD
jgi:exonuclease III